MTVSILILIGSLLIALSSWGSGFTSWKEAFQVGHVFNLLGIVGSVVLAWLGRSPIPFLNNSGKGAGQVATILGVLILGAMLLGLHYF